MIEIRSPLSRLAVSFRALGLLALGGAGLGLAIGMVGIRGSLDPFFGANTILPAARRFILLLTFGSGAGAAAAGGWFLLWRRNRPGAAGTLYDFARRLSPLALACFPILLFRRQVWVGKDLAFLTMVGLFVAGGWAAATAVVRTPPFRWEARLVVMLRGLIAKLDPRRRLRGQLPFGLVVTAALVYAVLVSRAALAQHAAVALGLPGLPGLAGLAGPGGSELAAADHLMSHLLHGGSLFKAVSRVGVVAFPGTAHAELIAYALVPVYALYQHPGTLLVLQSVLSGFAALPLFALCRAHVGAGIASVIALAYLLCPALHVENISDFHFLALGPIFLWSAWALLERGRDRRVGVGPGLAVRMAVALAVVLATLATLAVREDATLWILVMGAYFILVGRRPVAGLVVGAAGVAWFVVIDLAVLRRLGGMAGLLGPYAGFLPPGGHGMASVLATIVGNPALIVSTIADIPRLTYLLQMVLPVAFLPLRRPLWLLLFIPGFLFTLLPFETVSIRTLASPTGVHWIAFLFPGVALGIEAMRDRAGPGAKPHIVAIVGLLCATIPMAYRFSPLMEERNAAIGGRPHAARIDESGYRRRERPVDVPTRLGAGPRVA